MSRFRVPAVLCAFAFLLCELVSHPVAEMGICDDWSYVRTAQLLASTGHIVYNGWATAMLGWQLYVAAGLIKLFGSSFTVARMSTLIVAALSAFLIQRTMVRIGATERNAAIGTLAVVLSPLYLLLSATMMTDIGGLFAIVVCLYGCVRAIQSFPARSALSSGDTGAATRSAIGWLCVAAAANVVFGTSRQIAWLGVLVMVPCTAWLLRRHRGLLVAGVLATLAGGASVAWGMHWFKEQPYTLAEAMSPTIAGLHQALYMARQMGRELTNVPLFALAILIAFLPDARRGGARFKALVMAFAVIYIGLAVKSAPHHGGTMMLVPMTGDWVSTQGFFGAEVATPGPEVLGFWVRTVLTALVMFGTLCVARFVYRVAKVRHHLLPDAEPGRLRLTWRELGVVLGPFTLAYVTLLLPRSKFLLIDRYALALILTAVICLVQAYQDFARPALPTATVVAIAVLALFGIAANHDMFARSRARLQLAQELTSSGIPDTHLEGGFEYDGLVEIDHAGHINDSRIVNPPGSYIDADTHRGWSCLPGNAYELTPGDLHLEPQYGIAYKPDACRGPAPFAPASYFRWLGFRTATMYLVKFGPR